MTMKKINSVRRCRLCACEESFSTFSNIFEDEAELELELKITKLLPIVVMPWDPMSHLVCDECIRKLNSFNDFYETSLRAERFLRTLHPSAPDGDLETLDPVVRVMEAPILTRSPLKSPGRKRSGAAVASRRTRQSVADSTGFVESSDGKPESTFPKRNLNCFIVNHITTRDSVFTCRDCYRTFTTQSSALTHSCGRLECGELDGSEATGKSLPPLKIRLFSKRCGLFVCYMCQTAFELKAELVEHIRGHFLDGSWETEVEKKCKSKGRRRGRPKRDEGPEEKTTVHTKKRKCSGPAKKRGRPKGGGPCPSGPCEKCGKGPDSKEMVERTTQCSDEEEVRNVEAIKSSPAPFVLGENPGALSTSKVVEDGSDKNYNSETNYGSEKNYGSERNCGSENNYDSEKNDGSEKNYGSDDPVEILPDEGGECISDDVTVLEVFNSRAPTNFSSCVFCDKIFVTKEALIGHQNRHLQGYGGPKTEDRPRSAEPSPCRVCGMSFTSRRTLLEHEHFHQVDAESIGSDRRIRIPLGPHVPERDSEQDGHVPPSRELRILLPATEVSAIELI